MKTEAPPKVREPLYTFRYDSLGYDIALIPHTGHDSDRLKRKARKLNADLAKFTRDEILVALTWGRVG
jgi:hypothetical protein